MVQPHGDIIKLSMFKLNHIEQKSISLNFSNCFSKRIHNAKGIIKSGSSTAVLETCARMPTCPQFTSNNPYGQTSPLLQPDLTPVTVDPDDPDTFSIDPGQSVRLYSPLYNFPECNYPKDTEYKWKIKNTGGRKLTLIRHYMDILAWNYDQCRLNHLQLRNVKLRRRSRIRMCGRDKTNPITFESRSEFITVIFKTNGREVRGRGFDLEILAQDNAT